MSAPDTPEAAPAPQASAPARAGWARRNRPWIVLGCCLLVIAGFLALHVHRQGMFEAGPRLAIIYRDIPDDDTFVRATRMAVDQVNEAGGIRGEPLIVDMISVPPVNEEDETDGVINHALDLAKHVSRRDAVIAVIDHTTSTRAVPASAVYNRSHKLFLSTHSTASSLTERDFRFVFGLAPSNADDAAVIAHYALTRGMKRFVVLNDQTPFGIEAAQQFRRFATELGGKILFHGDLGRRDRTTDRLLLFLLDNQIFRPGDIDAFFISTVSTEKTIDFIKRSREMGLKVPILGIDNIFSRYIEEQVGAKNMVGVTSTSTFEPNSAAPETLRFATRFKELHGVAPDADAAIGYDAVRLFAFAATRVSELNASRLADFLHVMRYETPFKGATGPLVFSGQGLVTDTDVFVVRHDGEKYLTAATYRKPFNFIQHTDVTAPGLLTPQ
ncbi:ABC transporter substrate-binding protein [Xanthobacteraceae bacterium A53D]